MTRSAVAVVAALALSAPPGAAAFAAASSCAPAIGWRVVLASDASDPDVFLWDSRMRLVDYAAGRWNDTRAILAHTTLVPSGTEAVVVACAARAAHVKYAAADQDVVRVRVTRGQFRGRYGWVLSTDAHSSRPRRVYRVSAGRPTSRTLVGGGRRPHTVSRRGFYGVKRNAVR